MTDCLLDDSLPHWIAYWTYGRCTSDSHCDLILQVTHSLAGFEMTSQWYFRRIRKLFSEVPRAAHEVHPDNRKMIGDFISSWHVIFMEDTLSGLRNVDEWEDTDWETDAIFMKFKSYALKNEGRLDVRLRDRKYDIDDTVTFAIIAGDGRLESVSGLS